MMPIENVCIKHNKERREAISRERRLSMLRCGLAGAAAFIITHPIASNVAVDHLAAPIAALGYWPVLALSAVLTSLSAYPHLRGRSLAFWGLKHGFDYLPVHVAAAVGVACSLTILLLLQKCCDYKAYITPGDIPIALAAMLAPVMVLSCLPEKTVPRPKLAPSENETSEITLEAVRQWLAEGDRPVQTHFTDFFGAGDVAKSICDQITSTDDGFENTFAVIGPRGSGKTSVYHRLRAMLEGHQTLHICHISAWLYEDSDSLLRGVLQVLVESLASEVNVLQFRTVPAQYVASVSAVPNAGIVSAAMSLASGARDPESLITKLSDALVAIDQRVVLWIDDVERFHEVGNANRSIEPLRALLTLFASVPNITFVVAAATDQAPDLSAVYQKLATQIYHIGRIVPDRVVPLIRTFHSLAERIPAHDGNEWLSYWWTDTCFYGHSTARVPPVADNEDVNCARRTSAGIRLCVTPRALKAGLREALEALSELHGRVDLDHILLFSLLKHSDRVVGVKYPGGDTRQFVNPFTLFLEVTEGAIGLPDPQKGMIDEIINPLGIEPPMPFAVVYRDLWTRSRPYEQLPQRLMDCNGQYLRRMVTRRRLASAIDRYLPDDLDLLRFRKSCVAEDEESGTFRLLDAGNRNCLSSLATDDEGLRFASELLDDYLTRQFKVNNDAGDSLVLWKIRWLVRRMASEHPTYVQMIAGAAEKQMEISAELAWNLRSVCMADESILDGERPAALGDVGTVTHALQTKFWERLHANNDNGNTAMRPLLALSRGWKLLRWILLPSGGRVAQSRKWTIVLSALKGIDSLESRRAAAWIIKSNRRCHPPDSSVEVPLWQSLAPASDPSQLESFGQWFVRSMPSLDTDPAWSVAMTEARRRVQERFPSLRI